MWEFEATAADELGFKVGDVLRILEKHGEWWTASNEQGKTGLIPSNFVQYLI